MAKIMSHSREMKVQTMNVNIVALQDPVFLASQARLAARTLMVSIIYPSKEGKAQIMNVNIAVLQDPVFPV
jgi:hypothetical protein